MVLEKEVFEKGYCLEPERNFNRKNEGKRSESRIYPKTCQVEVPVTIPFNKRRTPIDRGTSVFGVKNDLLLTEVKC